ncbi:CpaF family protein [Roseburia sp. AM59-24XD]|jgi:pilus assembly protein CpaF|uniref:CpaF family protein n=1 Tax=Roseburia sp. AM59-24XD TaxID=2293138 RepID=UPI000E49F2E2|nr:CpaF family protein [Roseburia sp. AM59-24XD]RHP87036.1 CpaF family protein [Roseburia sp. AM59-24XD]
MSEKSLEKIQQEIQEELLRELEQGVSFSDEQMQDEIEIRVLKRGQMEYLTIEEKMELVKKIFNSVRRLDVLQELLEDPDITEIMINGPDHIFIEKGGRLLDSGKKFPSQAKLEDVIQQIVSKVNRVVNEASPIVDVRLLDGSRVNVVLPPVALDGPVMTIRRFPENPFDMDKLLELGSITEEAAVFLRTLVEARYNIFISGGTGSGKTTFLNALSNYIPSTERIVTIEDSAELQIQNIANLVRLETRNANLEGKNEITVRDLVRSALRQRPDRIIIGEIRDAAVIELLSAMNTGHDGSISTGHANSPVDMLRRLETLVLTGMDIPLQAVRSQIASAIEIVVQLGRLRDKSRKVLEIDEVCGIEDGEIVLRPLYKFQETKGSSKEHVKGHLVATDHRLANRDKLIMAGKETADEQ